MRTKIKINNLSNLPIDFNYYHGLASMLYHKLAESDVHLANEAHSKKGFKHYVFSGLLCDKPYKTDDKGIYFDKPYFLISSPDNTFIKTFCDGLLSSPSFYLNGYKGRVDMDVEEVEILPEHNFNSNEYYFKPISPIYIDTIRYNKPIALYPTDPKFYENIHRNLVVRYTEYYGKEPSQDYFDIIKIPNFRTKLITIDNTVWHCSIPKLLQIYASQELLKFTYDAGLGEKTAMGFGCVDII